MKSPDRGDSVETPAWWLDLANAAVTAHGLTLAVLGQHLGNAAGRSRPWDHGAMSRYLRGIGATRQWCDAMSAVLGVPRIYFAPRNVIEAIEMQAVARRHDTPRAVIHLTERSAAAVEYADAILDGIEEDARRTGDVKRHASEKEAAEQHRRRSTGVRRPRTPSTRS